MSVVTFSVVIPAYNAGGFLSESLESVRAQTCQDFEVIVVDDGSTDDTWDVIQGWHARFPGRFQGVRIAAPDNKGPGAARNIGVRHARGEFVAFLDSDDLWVPEHLLHANEAFLCHGERIGLFAGRSRILRADRLCHEFPWPSPEPQAASPQLLHSCYFQTSSVCVRRDLLLQVGGFAETLVCYEDWYLFLRLSQRTLFAHSAFIESLFRRREDSATSSGSRMSKPMYRDQLVAYLLAAQSGTWSAEALRTIRGHVIHDRVNELADYLCGFDMRRARWEVEGLLGSGLPGRNMWLPILAMGGAQFLRRAFRKASKPVRWLA